MATVEDAGRDPPNRRLRFQRVRIEEIYFKEWLCDEFKNSRYPMPENIRQGRNMAITLSFIEFGCCLLSFGFYDLRRSRIILALIIASLLTTLGGAYAKAKLSYYGLLAHACYAISVVGGFYIYLMIDLVIGTDTNNSGTATGNGNAPVVTQTWIMWLSSLPLLGLFFMGIYSCVLVVRVDEELDLRKAADNERLERLDRE